jgi:hypothetical protein
MPGPAYKPKPNQHISYPRLNNWVKGWLLGGQGLGGAGKQLIQSVDPRTKQGLLNAMAMLVPGKPSGENAITAFLGHSEFRGYRPSSGYNTELGTYSMGDPVIHGGQNAFQGGADMGYPAGLSGGNFGAVHGYSLPELLGLVESRRIAGPRRVMQAPTGGFLHLPYRTNKGLRN